MIPVFNEENTIGQIIELVEKVDMQGLGLEKELIIVDDCSEDSTVSIIKSLQKQYDNITLFQHACNKGKGAAIKLAIKHASGDILIVQDADLEYDPNDYVRCIQPILSGKADVVYGSRRLRKENKEHSSLWFLLGGIAVTTFFNVLYFRHLTDEPTCYKIFKADVLRNMEINGNRFDWEPEVTAKLAKGGIKIVEVPISYNPRRIQEGKKISWKDGIQAFWTLLKYRFIS